MTNRHFHVAYLFGALILWLATCVACTSPTAPSYRCATGNGAAPSGTLLPAPGQELKPVTDLKEKCS